MKKNDNINEANGKLTIKEMLDHVYATGMQQSRKIPTPPPIKMLCPLRDVDFSLVVKKAKKRKLNSGDSTSNEVGEQNEQDNNGDNDTHHLTHDDQLPPDYYEIYTSIKALGFDIDKFDFPGFCLLNMRANEIMKTKSKNVVRQYIVLKKSSLIVSSRTLTAVKNL